MKEKEKTPETKPAPTGVGVEPLVVPASIFLDRLTDFLGSSEGQTTEEVKAELREQGIDIDSFLSEAKLKTSLNIAKKVLSQTQKMEPVITDKGEIVLSQAQIDETCDKLKKIIKKLSND